MNNNWTIDEGKRTIIHEPSRTKFTWSVSKRNGEPVLASSVSSDSDAAYVSLLKEAERVCAERVNSIENKEAFKKLMAYRKSHTSE